MRLTHTTLKTAVLMTLVAGIAACGGTTKPNTSSQSSAGAAVSQSAMSVNSSSLAASSSVAKSSVIANASSSVQASEWINCANENAVCTLEGLRAVRFGNENGWQVALYKDSVTCTADVFNATASSAQRRCEYSLHTINLADPLSSLSASSSSSLGVAGTPPHSGTVFLDGDIIRAGDPTTYLSMVYKGQAERSAWHSELKTTRKFNAHIFELSFDDGDKSEIAVEDAIGNENLAQDEAKKLAIPLGQVPAIMRKTVNSVTIFAGTGRGTASGGGLISTYAADNDIKIRDGYLEEFLAHESTHTSLDAIYYADARYREAARADNNFVSTYAAENPNSEDISETIVPYLAVTLRADRISADWDNKIRAAMGNRIAFFDAQKLNFHPIHNTTVNVRSRMSAPVAGDTLQSSSTMFEWTLTPQATAYDLIVGTLGQGSNNIRASKSVLDASIIIDNLPDDGRKVFVRLRTQIGGKWRYEDYVYNGFNRDQTAAQLLTPQNGALLTATRLTLQWDRPKGAKRYDLVVGDEKPGSSNIRRSQPITSNSVELLNLPTKGQTLYLRLFTENTHWEYRDYTLTAANDSTRAKLLSPLEGSAITSPMMTFTWDSPLGASNYDLVIGTAGPGSNDIRSSSVISSNSLQVSNLPTNGQKLYVRLWTFKKAWEYIDYQF